MDIAERAALLLGRAQLSDLAGAGDVPYVRWQNVKRGRARMGLEEIEILGRVFPSYRWWLLTGEDGKPKGPFENPIGI
ncbi:DNA-binding protein [Pseudomonas reactans]|uniref:DNA-binding protein n=1 Tax=Pseudomonas reactans TaxID=117680 RepID=UPI0015A0A97C|nr:DNA-binding protein [Pseudomonas reactans]NWC86962.1 DNA-binding protein [Pseudomonas reactans]NWD28216.1 DNA-binding protein [Pseudomonas reactans]